MDRALSLLTAFGTGESLGVTELARRVGLPKSTAHRLLSILEERAFVTRRGVQYCLGTGLFELGSRVPLGDHEALEATALPFLEDLHAATQEIVHLAILDRGQVLYVAKLNSHASGPGPTRIGARLPAYCTALGKVLLAFSPPDAARDGLRTPLRPYTRYTLLSRRMLIEQIRRARSEGVAFDRQEIVYGLGCVAAPVLGQDDLATAAISVAGPIKTVYRHASDVRAVAGLVGQALASRTAMPALP